jgi:predicted DNA-binding protein
MYAVHRAEDDMKRTQIYLDEEMARTLAALSRQGGVTISQLVRESVLEKYMSRKEIDKASLARQISGIWAGRKDLKDIDRALRRLRRGTRLKRFRLG